MKKSFFLLHISIALASLTAVFGKLILLNEVLLTWYRMFFAFVILLIITGIHRKYKTKIKGREYLQIMLVGFLLGLHWIFFYGSIKFANISIGVICFCLTGFFTAVLSPLINKTRISIREVVLSLFTLVGITLIFSLDTKYRIGITLGVISSFLVALFTIFNEGLSKKHEALPLTQIQMFGGAAGIGLLMPLYLYLVPISYIIPSWSDLVYLLLLSGICTVLMYVMLAKALRYISAFTVNLSFNLEPIYAIILAVAFFGEYNELNLSFYIGLALIALSLVLQMFFVFKTKNQDSPLP